MATDRATVSIIAFGILVLSFASTAKAADPEREVGRPFLQNFALRDYHAHNQNWAAVQDADGVLYFGNKNVVLEYDGVAWKKITVTRTTYVRGLAIEPATGTIFVGGVDELGYLKGERFAEKQFVSLLDKLPPDARDFRDIRRVYSTPRGIFFVADQQVMRWHEGAFKVWNLPNRSRLQSYLIAEQLYVQQPETGLLRLDGDTFVAAASDPLFQHSQLTLLAAAEDGSLIAGTYTDGLFFLREGAVVPFPTEVDAFLKEKKIRRGMRLRNGSLALATASSGLIVLSPDGHLRSRVDESVDLQNDTILDLFEDREAVLWLCLNSGITRVEVDAALSIFDAANGLKRTTARDILRFGGTLYFATGDGIYRLLPADPATGKAARCERLQGSEGEWWSFSAHESGLLAAGIEGVFQLDQNGALRKIAPGVVALALRRSRVDPDRIYIGTRHGLRSIHREPNGDWREEGQVAETDEEIRTIVEDKEGRVWLGTPISGIFEVTFASNEMPGPGRATVKRFYETDGLPKGQHWTRAIEDKDGEALFATQEGLYRFDQQSQKFQPVAEFDPRFSNGSFMLGSAAEDKSGDLWLAGRSPEGPWPDQELCRAFSREKDLRPRFQTLPYKIADKVGEIEKFYPESENGSAKTVWIGGTEGAIRVDADALAKLASAPGFETIIRNAVSTDSSTGEIHSIGREALPHSRNSVRFEFAANTYTIGANPRYQTRLQGFEQGGWSEFSDRPRVEYTNLPGGSYVFAVRARDANGRLGSVASLAFQISPPWYRTFAAYGAYALSLFGAMVGLAHWQMRRYRRKQAILEDLVAARTAELRAREAELVNAKDAADAANRAKSAFLANMSHELRTPLNAILGYAQILLKDDALSSRNRERLAVLDQSGNHLLAMINEVLDLSKIEAGKLTVNPEEFSLGDLIEDICAAFRQRVAEKGLQFHCHCADELKGTVRGDPGKLRQVLFNLLGNAVKFTERGRVTLEVTRSGLDRVRCEVSDTGIGIASEELKDIFLTFHQSSQSKTAGPGTGLGLAISERLVELLGGQLEVASTVGQGSRFWFEIDLPAAAEAKGPAVSSTDSRRVSPIGFSGARRRLLIADDDATNRSVLREFLAPLGFGIDEVSDGAASIERCIANPPDALLLDLQMAPVDGFEVTRELRARAETRELKIVAVSASVFEDDRQHAINAGCDDFLPKPFKEDQLLSVLGRVLNIDWIYRDASKPEQSAAACAGTRTTPPLSEIDGMLELSRRGDILGIKKRLAALAGAGQDNYADFVAELQPFVATFQMNRIRDVLLRLKSEAVP